MSSQGKIILGIDPGSLIMGYAVIRIDGKKAIDLMEMGVLKLSKYPEHAMRLKKIYEKVHELSANFKPTSCAIEAPFFGKNVQSMLKLGRAQGVAMAAAIQADVPVIEYSPKKVKQSVTGNGNASKEQVQRTVQQILKFTDPSKYLDATDAVAVALCHHYQSGIRIKSSGSSDWSTFIKENKHRIKKK